MEKLGRDELGLVLKNVSSEQDRKSCSQVCKNWLRIEGLSRSSLRVLEPESLRNFLPRFPNLVTFHAGRGITDADLDFVAKTCHNIKVLNLSVKQAERVMDEFEGLGSDDIGDDGLCAVAMKCPNLTSVALRRRKGIGDIGVIALIKFSQNLTIMDLSWCDRITDQALEAIAAANSLQALNLHGCYLVTTRGLISLAIGSSSRTLKVLDVSECDQITDSGVSLLQHMSCIEELNLAECGPKVTDICGVAIASIRCLRRLNLSWLFNISDVTLLAIAQNCKKLVSLDVTGCDITGTGIRSFANHDSLEVLKLASCYSVSCGDIEQTILECRNLKHVRLDGGLRGWMPISVQQRLSRLCRIEWR
ncbi:F-box/LRR-repeat protein 4-like [Aristolochia californica]|uniref:F-box/LRR-repeat protein 4-like n=1 Tax=Aristolochia californica TaxID=171875 RepID=UPI0035DB7471